MKLSYVILTHNRREELLATLERLPECTRSVEGGWETIVVDNASDDGTADAVKARWPAVRSIRRETNEGSFARNYGAEAAKGEFIIFLDDDSYPVHGTAARSIAHLERHPKTALVGGRVILPDGSEDAAAMPIIMPACALCVRRAAFIEAGGFDREFFRQAEEYDLIFRILQNGHEIERFEDLVYRHEKTPRSRNHALIHQMDLRNNLLLLHRYLPRGPRRIYRRDWLRRYAMIARHEGHTKVIAEAVKSARAMARRQEGMFRELSPALIERVFDLRSQRDAVKRWAMRHGIRRAVIADYSKNLFATWSAAGEAGVKTVAIADESDAFVGAVYRGVPVEKDELALSHRPDGVILSNVNPARIDRRLEALSRRFSGPILRLWSPRFLKPLGGRLH